MRTSPSQFELMVTFMEQHGDLSKPCSNARGRITSINHWEELTGMLNSDGSGDTKTCDKWKKVWSDFKNNTKKKAARLHRAAQGTGGGPATFVKISDLEQRVLTLIGVQVATGLMVEEAGLSQRIHTLPNTSLRATDTPAQQQNVEYPEDSSLNIVPPLPASPMRAISSPPLAFIEVEVESSQPLNEPGHSMQPHATPLITEPVVSPPHPTVEVQVEHMSPNRLSSPVHVARPQPALSGQTTPRRSVRNIRSPRRRRSPRRLPQGQTHTELATQQFLHAEEQWRKFRIDQHRDYMEMRREQNRIREMEVQAQRGWQTLGLRALELLERLVNKYCNNN